MNNSDENLFWFVNFIKIKDLVINKDLLKVVNDYQYKSKTSETNVKIEITEEYVEKFKNHFQNERFYYTKYWLKYSVKRSENDTKNIPNYNEEQEKIIVKSTIIMILYLLEYRKVETKSKTKKKKLQAFVDDYIVKLCRTIAKRISIESFDILIHFLLFLSFNKITNPTIDDKNLCSIENVLIMKILLRILKQVFIEDREDDEVVETNKIEVFKTFIEFMLNEVIGNTNDEKVLTPIQKANRFLFSHYYKQLGDLFSLSYIIKYIHSTEATKIETIFTTLFSHIFHKSFNFHSMISPIAEIIRKGLLDLDSISALVLQREAVLSSFPINLINKLISNQNPIIDSGFYINDTNTKMIIKDFKLNKDYRLHFSFFIIPHKGQYKYPIFSLIDENNHSHNIYCVLKENQKGTYQILLNEQLFNIELQPYKLNQLGIQYNRNEVYLVEGENDSLLYKTNIVLDDQIKYLLCIGCVDNVAFGGVIRNIIYCHIPKDEKKNENNTLTDKLDNYDSFNTTDSNNQKDNWVVYPSILQFVPYNDNINGVIVPNKAMEFKLRVGDKKVLTIQMTQFHKNFYSFISPPSLTTFVNNDGLSLIFLLLEYFYQLLSRLKRKSYPNTEEILKIM